LKVFHFIAHNIDAQNMFAGPVRLIAVKL